MSRIRTNLITNRMANGAPTVSNGLVISGVTTSTNVSVASSVTATTYYGSGANLTNITSTTINNNADNRVITGSNTSNTLEGESNVVINGGKLGIGVASPAQLIEVHGASNPAVLVQDTTNNCISYMYSQDSVATFGSASNHPVVFNVSNSEKLRILSNGNVLIGTTVDGNQALNVYGAANAAMVIQNSNTGTGANNGLYIGNGNSTISYIWNYENDSMRFATNNTERLRIDSSGNVTIYTGNLTIPDSIIHSGDTDTKIAFTDNNIDFQAAGASRFKVTQYATYVQSGHPLAFLASSGATPNMKSGGTNNQDLLFTTGSGNPTRLQITSAGQVTKPSQASFAAYVGSNAYSLHNQVFPFNNTNHNIGNHFNTSNYRFTAPVAGRYLFNFHSIYQSNGQQDVQIRINNSSGSGKMFHVSQTGSNWDQASCSYILNLNANDYVTMWSVSSTGWHGNNWGMFSGELLS